MIRSKLIIQATPEELTDNMNEFFDSQESQMFELIKIEITQVMLGFNKLQNAPVMGLAATIIYSCAAPMAPIGDSQE